MKLTVTWARRTLRAVDELIVQYKDGGKTHCPLCKAAGLNKRNEFDCSECVWVVFKGYTCGEERLEGDGYNKEWDFNYFDDPIPLRLRRLYGWRVRLKNIIEKGGASR